MVKTTYDLQWGNVVEVPVIQTINEAIEFLEDIFKKQKEIQQKQEILDKKLAKNEISQELYHQESENNLKNWNKLLEVQINIEKFIEKNPLLTPQEANELVDLQKNSFLVSNKITSKDIENAKYRSKKTTEILENLKKREKEINGILIKLFECPDCDNTNLFFDALSEIAKNVGKKKAEYFIKQWEDYYKTGVASTETHTIEMTLNETIKIYRKNEKFKKMFTKIQKGISIKGAASAMGFYNTYKYTDKINIEGKIIHYKGEIKIKDIEEFHIYAVEYPKSGKNTFDGSEDYQIRFLNKNNIVVCILYFNSEKDINLIWEYYYTKEMKKMQENVIKEYDYKHNTKYYKIFNR